MKRIIAACCGVAVLLGGIWLYVWWHGPAETKQFTAGDQTTQGVLGSETTLLPWRTAYFTTQYPSSLRIITSNEVAHGITTGQYVLGSVSLKQTDQLAVTVGALKDMTLSELPAVEMRRQHPEIYQPTDQPFIPEGGVAFSSKQDYEVAVFWQSGDRYAAVVASGSSARKAELDQALQAVAANWQWR